MRDFIEHAESLGESLLRQARNQPDGSVTWGPGADRRRQPVADSGPFNGRCGEAFLLASLYRATHRPELRGMALRALEGILGGLAKRSFEPTVARLSLGLSGVGGMIYVLVRMARMLEEPELQAAAVSLSAALTPERITADNDLDVTWGCAGALLSQLVLAETVVEEASGEKAMARAELCARHLLARRTADAETGHEAWVTLSSLPSTGFAHGAAGIAHALLRYFLRTGDDACYRAGLDAFAFERQLYRESQDNWLASRQESDREPKFCSWCHGAPGIALSRLKSLECVHAADREPIVQDLLRALRATARGRLPSLDTLCCGYFGRIDILLEAGRRLGNDSLVRQAERLSRIRLGRADQHGLELDHSGSRDPIFDGFWQGTPGVAYTLLRLQAPESFPCVLALD
ncbi:MAG: hypothetical protein MI919_26480 [Holophagales bacterium]|nr:hypothetical protein [Holophagales bacterium]